MRLRFTIRDLLWLTAIIAVSIGWWIDRAGIRQERRKLDQEKMIVTMLKVQLSQEALTGKQ